MRHDLTSNSEYLLPRRGWLLDPDSGSTMGPPAPVRSNGAETCGSTTFHRGQLLVRAPRIARSRRSQALRLPPGSPLSLENIISVSFHTPRRFRASVMFRKLSSNKLTMEWYC